MVNMDDDSQPPNPESPQEPSVLDYIKSRLSFGRSPRIDIPDYREDGVESEINLQSPASDLNSIYTPASPIPWLSLAALSLELFGQLFFEPPNPSALVGIGFYMLAFGFLLMAVLRGQWVLAPLSGSSSGNDPLSFRPRAFLLSIPFAVLAF